MSCLFAAIEGHVLLISTRNARWAIPGVKIQMRPLNINSNGSRRETRYVYGYARTSWIFNKDVYRLRSTDSNKIEWFSGYREDGRTKDGWDIFKATLSLHRVASQLHS